MSLEKELWIDHQPVSGVSDSGPITFLSLGTEDYADLAKTILVARAKVTKANGNDLDAHEKVGIVNNFLYCLFKQVDVFLKEKQVTQATGTYAYRAYLETLLNYGPAAKQSQLTAAMFYKDTAGKMDVADPTAIAANANMGLKKRYAFSQESGIIEMAGPLFYDVFRSERLLLSFVDLKIILNRKRQRVLLMASENDADYRVKLTEAYLKLRKVKVSPSISIAHELALKKGPAIYPVRRVEAKLLSFHNVFNGLVPKTFVFGMVDSEAFYGATIKILTTLKPIPHPSSRLLSMEKKYPSNPYSFPIRQQMKEPDPKTSKKFCGVFPNDKLPQTIDKYP